MTHPYSSLPDHNFWSRSVTHLWPGHIDPVVAAPVIKPSDKVATVGSCFAQHLSRKIQQSGFCYFVAEAAPESMSEDEAKSNNYGVFSARYGNIYTVRQAVQLFDRAYGIFQPGENIWTRGDVYVDGFRPQIQSAGFASKSELLEDRERHLSRVREVFEKCDWLIFTLGLTEAWRSRAEGTIFPVAPGVSGGEYDESEHEFINFDIAETLSDLSCFIEKLLSVNPGIRIVLTVSPVPLIATYEKRHVLVSTTYSKAVLRVAAGEAEKRFSNVVYFPSFEIITSPASGGRYYADDLRQVTNIGVSHVMRVFTRHFMGTEGHSPVRQRLDDSNTRQDDESGGVICDEELIEKAIRESGIG